MDSQSARPKTVSELRSDIAALNLTINTPGLSDKQQAFCQARLSDLLSRIAAVTGAHEDHDGAVDAARNALTSTIPEDGARPGRLNNLGNRLAHRYLRFGNIQDLRYAISFIEEAVKIAPTNQPEQQAAMLNNLGRWVANLSDRTGAMKDLDRAIELADQSLAATSADDPGRLSRLHNLGNHLGRRFERSGTFADLQRTVEVTERVVSETPRHCAERGSRLNSLACRLFTRSERTGELSDLDQAIDLSKQALETISATDPDWSTWNNNLGYWLAARARRTDDMNDLNEAIRLIEKAVQSTPEDDVNRVSWWNNLGSLYGRCFKLRGSIADLQKAVDCTSIAVSTGPHDHPDRAVWLNSHAVRLKELAERTKSFQTSIQCLSCFKESWNCQTAPPSIRIYSAYGAAVILAKQSDWQESSKILSGAVMLLPTLSSHFLQQMDKQWMLEQFVGLASMAAAVSLEAGRGAFEALKLLELGRNVIAGLLLEIRTDISNLQEEHSRLAEEFISLRSQLEAPVSETPAPTVPWEAVARGMREADRRFNELLHKIRSQQGFEKFLLPPTENELCNAAQDGPVIVVNVSQYRCDAFVIQQHGISLVRLPRLNLEDIETNLRILRSYQRSFRSGYRMARPLEWLWDAIACPTLQELDLNTLVLDEGWPCIWWVLTGPLSHFPLHAAGRHNNDSSTETVLDRTMSSYSSSVKALVYGRQHRQEKTAKSTLQKALLIAMEHTTGHKDLAFATEEVGKVREFCLSLGLDPLQFSHNSRQEILSQIRNCRIFHFAGHGESDISEPSQSGLFLDNQEKLTVADLREQRLQDNSPFLGYLSACWTGINRTEKLADEAIHLIGAFQLAGFRNVVGTLWAVSDPLCVDAAVYLYKTIEKEGMEDYAVCLGLHRALHRLREEDRRRAGMRDSGKIMWPDERTHKSTASQFDTVSSSKTGSSSGNSLNQATSTKCKEGKGLDMREATLHGVNRQSMERDGLFDWVPYVHFGL